MIYVTAVFEIDAEHRNEIVAAMTKWSTVARQLPGCLAHGFYADLADANSIRFYGEWESVEARKTTSAHPQLSVLWEVMNSTGVKTENGSAYTATPLT